MELLTLEATSMSLITGPQPHLTSTSTMTLDTNMSCQLHLWLQSLLHHLSMPCRGDRAHFENQLYSNAMVKSLLGAEDMQLRFLLNNKPLWVQKLQCQICPRIVRDYL